MFVVTDASLPTANPRPLSKERQVVSCESKALRVGRIYTVALTLPHPKHRGSEAPRRLSGGLNSGLFPLPPMA